MTWCCHYMISFCYYLMWICYNVIWFCYCIILCCYYLIWFCHYMIWFCYYMMWFCYYMIWFCYYMMWFCYSYESNVFRYNKILIDCVFRNSKFVVPSTLTIDLGFASVNSQCLRDNKLAIPSFPVNKYIILTGCANKDK